MFIEFIRKNSRQHRSENETGNGKCTLEAQNINNRHETTTRHKKI